MGADVINFGIDMEAVHIFLKCHKNLTYLQESIFCGNVEEGEKFLEPVAPDRIRQSS